MKKILFILIAIGLIFGVFSLAKAQENKVKLNAEKINSPEEIEHFSNIFKKGKDLFGFRKRIMEKIKSLEELDNFEEVKKIGSSLWGIRKLDSQALVRPETVSCVKNAIDKKDGALKNGSSLASANFNNLIDARNTCQKAALDKTTIKEQREANKICINNFKKAIEDGKKIIREEHRKIWKTYQDDLKACGLLQSSTSGSDKIKIEDGGIGF